MKTWETFILRLAVLLTVAPVARADYFVDQNNLSPEPPHTNWITAAVHIQDAVNAATEGSTVWIAPGVYTAPPNPTNYHGSDHVVHTTKLLTLRSASGNPDDTILDGGGVNRVLAVQRGSTALYRMELDGLTLRYGYATNHGGAILCNLTGNSVWAFDMQNCVISSNTVEGFSAGTVAGGGVYNYNTASAFSFQATDSRFVGNLATNTVTTSSAIGGALHLRNRGTDTKRFVGCIFEDNVAGSDGGGISAHHGALVVSNSVFRGNKTRQSSSSSSGGGGIHLGAGVSLHVFNTLMYENVASGPAGGGGAIGGGSQGVALYEVVNSTIVANTRYGIRWRDWAAAQNHEPYLRLVNSIVYWNTVANLVVPFTENPEKSMAFNSCFYPTNVANLIVDASNTEADPRFVDLEARNFRLTQSSPCVNTGMNQPWMIGAKDLDGAPRIDRLSGKVDMGCYEYVYPGTILLVR